LLSFLLFALLLASLLELELELLPLEALPLFPESLLPESRLDVSLPELFSEPEFADAPSPPLCLLDEAESEPLSELPLLSLPLSDFDDPEDVPAEFLRA